MAETLVHEFAHVKLCGLMDMVQLVEPGGQKVYAPWRQDPRPASGLLQGVYAHLAIARFWHAQMQVATAPDDLLRAEMSFARWRSAINGTVGTLLGTGCLTPEGVRFAGIVQEEARALESAPVPEQARQAAAEAAMDHRLTWQLRHTAIDPDAVPMLAMAYRRGRPFQEQDP